MKVKKLNYKNKRIEPRKIAEMIENDESFNIDLPLDKLDRLIAAIPKHFDGKLKLKLIARNADAAEILTGTLMGALLGMGLAIIAHSLKRIHSYIIIASTIVGAALAYFITRYEVDFYVRYGANGSENAHLKFRAA